MTPGFAQTCWARWFVGTLAKASVREWIVSPGSRSTPFLAAALEQPDLALRIVVDERSAAYFALGRARATGHPVALLCTSGTAAANYFPAIVEANLCHAPLVVLTADRPEELGDCGASQTIQQSHLYGGHVRRFVDFVPGALDEPSLFAVRRRIFSTLEAGRNPLAGPVHFNLRAHKPLEPTSPQNAEERSLLDRILAWQGETPRLVPHPIAVPSPETVRELVSAMDEPLGLITCGFDSDIPPLDPLALAAFARATGYPILIDGSHPLRLDAPAELEPYLIAPHDPLLRIPAWRRAQAPRLVIQVARPLISSAWQIWLEVEPRPRIMLLARNEWTDPIGRANWVSFGDPSQLLRQAAEEFLVENSPRSSGWQARWFRARAHVHHLLDPLPVLKRSGLGELEAVGTLLKQLPPNSKLVVANSLPIREVDLLSHRPQSRVSLVSLRGASGIDGVISFASAFALEEGEPTVLLTGDLSFLHDVGGLWTASDVGAPFAIVVLNNSGGRIFEQLPIARAVSEQVLAYWTTPQSFDLSAAARLYNVEYRRAEKSRELSAHLDEALSHPATTLIEVVVVPGSAREDSAALVKAVEHALAMAGLTSEPQSQ